MPTDCYVLTRRQQEEPGFVLHYQTSYNPWYSFVRSRRLMPDHIRLTKTWCIIKPNQLMYINGVAFSCFPYTSAL